MVKKKKVAKKSVIDTCALEIDSGQVSWWKVIGTLVFGALLGLYFGNSSLLLGEVMLFIAIILIVLCLALLIDIRKHLIK